MSDIEDGYDSPRVSSEFLDCALPFTFDSYSRCSFSCQYCFSLAIRETNPCVNINSKPKKVSLERVKKLFSGENKSKSGQQYYESFIENEIPLHWGGLNEPFCHFERKYKHGIKLLKYFSDINYPVFICTKGYIPDEALKIFKDNPDNFAVQFTLISTEKNKIKKIEVGAASPQERLEYMRKCSNLGVKTLLRFRPYIIGLSDITQTEVIEESAKAGANAISIEFLCYDSMSSKNFKENHYQKISDIIGYDLEEYYRATSVHAGYLRLNSELKNIYMKPVLKLARKNNMTIGISDPDLREYSDTECCCGLGPKDGKFSNYIKGNFSGALIEAKRNDEVSFDYIEKEGDWFNNFKLKDSGKLVGGGFNSAKGSNIIKWDAQLTLMEYVRNLWNDPSSKSGPFFLYQGKIFPVRKDENNNLVYKYKKEGRYE